MTIRAYPAPRGLPPLDEPLAALAVEQRLLAERERTGERSLAAPTRLRCSDARACARKIAFSSLGIPRDLQYDQATMLSFSAGDWYHQVVQESLVQRFDARCEVVVDWTKRDKPLSLSGHCDAVYTAADGRTVAVEIKSMAGYGFDLAVGARRSDEGPGPKHDHLAQVGLYAFAPQIQAQAVHIIYVNKDRCTVAEWLLGVDEPLTHLLGPDGEPLTLRSIVKTEVERLRGVLGELDARTLPGRLIPGWKEPDDWSDEINPRSGGACVINPPERGSKRQPWQCAYCSWQPSCAQMDAGPMDGWVTARQQAEAS